MLGCTSVVIEEQSNDEPSSDGIVDAVIERDADASSAGAALGLDPALLSVAARLLRSPGVQQEICAAALADPEVFEILASKIELVGCVLVVCCEKLSGRAGSARHDAVVPLAGCNEGLTGLSGLPAYLQL